MSDIYLFSFMTITFFLIGFPLSKLIPSNFTMRFLIAPTLGYGVSAIIVTLMYKWGMPISIFFRIFIVAAIIMGFWFCYNALKTLKVKKRNNLFQANKTVIILLIIWLLGSSILLAPKLTGGNQFAVFQGNHGDTFSYLSSAVVYSKEPYSTIINSDVKSFIDNPLKPYALAILLARPSVSLLYSFVGQLFPFQYYKLHYTFLIFFFSQVIMVLMFFLANLFKNAKPVYTGLVALVFPLGFWGQYILDINAWSQISSVPIFLLIVALTLLVFGMYHDQKISTTFLIRIMAVLTILFASGTYLYPESLLFHLAMLSLPTGIYFCYCIAKKYNWKIVFALVGGIILGISTGFLYYNGTIGFVLNQTKFVKLNVNWWLFFQAFFAGKDGLNTSLFNNISDALAGFMGLYFVTPSTGSIVIALVTRLVILIFTLYILLNLLLFLKKIISQQHIHLNTSGSLTILFFFIFILLSVLPVLYLLLIKNYWAAGKVLSYISPYYILVLCFPLLLKNEKRTSLNFTTLLIIFIVLQISFGVIRINEVRKPNGIHYSAPYPSTQDGVLKEWINWDVEQLYPQIKASNLIKIDVRNVFIENYLMIYLYTIDKKFYTSNIVTGFGQKLGYQKPEGTADFIITESQLIHSK